MEGFLMYINELEDLADVVSHGWVGQGKIGAGHYMWTSLLSGSTFLTEDVATVTVIKERNETDRKFSISQLRQNIEANPMQVSDERLNKLKTRLNETIRQQGCLCRADKFCDYVLKCQECEGCEHETLALV
jgi:hypothetical protein